MRIDLGHGAHLEPDPEPRASQFHQRILRTRRIPRTLTGNYADLACGHRVMLFGNLDLAGGVALCTQCREGAEEAAGA